MKAALAIAAELREQIARGELRAGDPLPVERLLVEELDVSKGVVREALRILENEGLLEVRRGLGGGPRVRHPSLAEAALGMGVYLQIGHVPVRDVWESRDRLVASAIEHLASTNAEESVDALEAAVAQLADATGDFAEYYLRLLDIGEITVALAGRATDAVLVAGLRHVISRELEAATNAAVAVDVRVATDAEDVVTGAWRDVVRNVRLGRPAAARRSFERQALMVREGLDAVRGEATVVDVFTALSTRSTRPRPLARSAEAERSVAAD
jgi:GntR family transcriptional regulator, transcriptional repressor for pyruvate dehydrogenase complex